MPTRADQSGWLVELTDTLELIAVCPPPARGLAHYSYDRGLPFAAFEPWTPRDRIRKPHFGGPFVGASLIRNIEADLEMIVAQADGALAHFRLRGIHGWQGPVFLPGKAAGAPAFIRSRFGATGNYEVIVPKPGGGLSHFWRDNDGGDVWRAVSPPINTGTWSGVSLIHSNFGNLEIAGVRDGQLVFLWQDGPGGLWSPPQPIGPARPSAGRPGLIQSSYGVPGNFELVVPRADGGIEHLWRDNTANGFPWMEAGVFGAAGGKVYDDVTLIQSSSGRLEVIARVSTAGILEHFRASLGADWEGPLRTLIMSRDKDFSSVTVSMG